MSIDIVAQARTWLGTPFHHQGRLKGVGCDCLGMIVGIADELNLTKDGKRLAALDNIHYSTEPNTAELLQKLDNNLTVVTDMQPGDMVLIKIAENPQHMGIITPYPRGNVGILHAIRTAGVVEHRLNDAWKKRIYKIYRFNG